MSKAAGTFLTLDRFKTLSLESFNLFAGARWEPKKHQ